MAFTIDTKGQTELLGDGIDNAHLEDDSDDDFDFIPFPSSSKEATTKSRSTARKNEGEIDLDDTYIDFGDSSISRVAASENESSLRSIARKLADPNKLLEKSVVGPGVEKLNSLPSYDESRRLLQRKRRLEREKSAGKNWFNMKAPEITEEMKNDLEILKMRSALDTKHFYKKNDFKTLPKYFQVGRIVESAADFYHSRIPKKDRKKTLVDELLADAEFQKSAKKRYKEIITEQQKTHFKAHREAKRLKRKKK